MLDNLLAANLLAPKFIVLYVFVASALFVHFRGRVRHKLTKQLADHSTIMAPYNSLMYLFSAVPAKPILDPRALPELDVLRDNWQVMRDEALSLFDDGRIRAATGHNDLGFNSFFKNGWKRFYVKWYGAPLPSAQAPCPKTVALVESLPYGQCGDVRAAAARRESSTAIAIRSPDRCAITWGSSLPTPMPAGSGSTASLTRGATARTCCSTRPSSTRPRTRPTRRGSSCSATSSVRSARGRCRLSIDSSAGTVIRAASTQNTETEPVGALNRIYAMLGHGSDLLTRLKRRNRTAFRAVKYTLIAALAYWIFIY